MVRVGDLGPLPQGLEASLIQGELVHQEALACGDGRGLARELDAEHGQDRLRGGQSLLHTPVGDVEEHLEVVHRDLVEEIAGMGQDVVGQALGGVQVGAEIGHLDLGHGQIARELVVRGPAALRHQRHGRAQEAARGLVGHGLPGPAAGGEADARGQEALVEIDDARGAEVEVLGELEDAALAFVGRERAFEQARDAEVGRGLAGVGDERVRGLLHAIVREAVHARRRGGHAVIEMMTDVRYGQGLDEAHLDRGYEIGMERGRGVLAQDGQGAEIEGSAHAGGNLEGAAAEGGQALHAVDHRARPRCR